MSQFSWYKQWSIELVFINVDHSNRKQNGNLVWFVDSVSVFQNLSNVKCITKWSLHNWIGSSYETKLRPKHDFSRYKSIEMDEWINESVPWYCERLFQWIIWNILNNEFRFFVYFCQHSPNSSSLRVGFSYQLAWTMKFPIYLVYWEKKKTKS